MLGGERKTTKDEGNIEVIKELLKHTEFECNAVSWEKCYECQFCTIHNTHFGDKAHVELICDITGTTMLMTKCIKYSSEDRKCE